MFLMPLVVNVGLACRTQRDSFIAMVIPKMRHRESESVRPARSLQPAGNTAVIANAATECWANLNHSLTFRSLDNTFIILSFSSGISWDSKAKTG